MKKFVLTPFLILISSLAFCQENRLERARNFIAQDSTQNALEILIPIDQFEPIDQPNALSLLGSAHVKLKNDSLATLSYKQALSSSRDLYDIEHQTESLYWLTRLSAINGKFDQAIIYGEEGTVLARLHQNNSMEFRINNFLSWAYFMTNKDFLKVLIHEARQAHLVNAVGNDMQKAMVYNNLGYDLTIAGTVHLDSAIHLMTWANSQYGKIENNEGRWYTLMNLTWQHRLKGEYEKSIDFGKLSLAQAQKDEDRHAIIEASMQLGETFIAINNLNEAENYFKVGLEQSLLKEDRDKYVFDVYFAHLLHEMNQTEKAIDLLENAVKFLVTSEVFYEMHGRALLAQYYIEMDKPALAKKQLDLIAQPRHNYIAMETKCLAAIAEAQLNQQKGKAILLNWKKRSEEIGANQLVELLEDANENLSQ